MRVVHVTRQFAPAIGGLEEAVLSLSRELRKNHGIDVEVVTLDRVFSDRATPLPSSDLIEGIRVSRIPFRGSRRYPVAPGVLGAIRNADLVHVHGIDFFFDALALAAPLHRKPLVATTHGGFFHTRFAARLKTAYFNSVTRLASSAYREIFATSENDGVLFRRIAGEKVRVVENGVNVSKWADRASPSPLRTLIYFGRLSANKRVDLLLPLLRELRTEEDWRLIIAGRADDLGFEQLAAMAGQLGVGGAVTLVPSPSAAEIGDLIAKASYYISCSEHEGFGISAVEAMSAGLVPVLSRIPAFERFVKPGAGILVEPADSAATARAVRELHAVVLQDFRSMRAAVIATSRQFDEAAVSDTIAASYRRILAPN